MVVSPETAANSQWETSDAIGVVLLGLLFLLLLFFLFTAQCLSSAFFFREFIGDHSKGNCNQDRILGWDVSLPDSSVFDNVPVNLKHSRDNVVDNVDPAVRLLPSNPKGRNDASYHVSAVKCEEFALARDPRKRWILKDLLRTHDCLNVGCQEHNWPKNVPSQLQQWLNWSPKFVTLIELTPCAEC